jgi:hypothetical protein
MLERCVKGRCVKGRCDAQELAELGVLWQRRVRHLLIDQARDPGAFMIRPVERRTVAVSHRALASLS